MKFSFEIVSSAYPATSTLWKNMIVNANNQVRTFFPARIFDFDISATTFCKVEKILKGRRDSIPSPSKSCEHLIFVGKTFLGLKSLLTKPSNVLLLHLKPTFPPIIWIFTEGEGDGMELRPLLNTSGYTNLYLFCVS